VSLEGISIRNLRGGRRKIFVERLPDADSPA